MHKTSVTEVCELEQQIKKIHVHVPQPHGSDTDQILLYTPGSEETLMIPASVFVEILNINKSSQSDL